MTSRTLSRIPPSMLSGPKSPPTRPSSLLCFATASSSGTRRQADAVTGLKTAPDDDASKLFYQPPDTTCTSSTASILGYPLPVPAKGERWCGGTIASAGGEGEG